jgi:hypothetical protein
MEAKEELTSVVKTPKILTGLKRQGVNQMTRNKVSREELRRESMPQRNGKEERFKESINGTNSKVCSGYENNSYSKQEADRTHKFTSKDKADVPMQAVHTVTTLSSNSLTHSPTNSLHFT